MMGAEEDEVPPQMETLALNESSQSLSNYRSAMSTLSSASLLPADTDPLLSPPPEHSLSSPLPAYNNVVLSALEEKEEESVRIQSSDAKIEIPRPDLEKSPPSNSKYLKILVSNPQKEVEPSNSIVPGGNTFVTYLITTKTNFSEYRGTDFVVRRRFRDVVTLSDRLSEGYRGFFIPPRPDKSVVESQVMQKQEFVEQRRVALEKYLSRLAAHPVIGKSDELRVFLQAQGRLPLATSADMASRVLDGAVRLPGQLLGDAGSVVEPQDVVQPAKGGRDLLRIFKEMRQAVSNDWVGARPAVEEEDKEFLKKKERLRDLELQISGTSQQAESLVKSQQHMAETMGELGLALIKLTKFENQNAMLNTQRIRAGDMKNAATVTVKGSRLYRELNAQTVKYLDTLHEYLGLMLVVDAAFSDRSSALLTVQTLISDLSSLHSKVDKLETASSRIFGNDKNKEHKVEELKENISVTENAKSCAIKEYERIKENNRREIERLDKERKNDFVNMLKGFVINQVVYTEKVAAEWTKVVEGTNHYVKDNT